MATPAWPPFGLPDWDSARNLREGAHGRGLVASVVEQGPFELCRRRPASVAIASSLDWGLVSATLGAE